MKKYAKIINKETKQCEVGLGTNSTFYQSIGMAEMEVEQAYDGSWYLMGYAPIQPIEEQNEAIRSKREQLFSSSPCADYKYDYEEDVARYGQDSEQAKASADIWLAEKDKIRTENPYIEEDNSDSVLSIKL